MTNKLDMNRRQFVVTSAAVAGGLAIGVRVGGAGDAFAAGEVEMNPWLMIAPDSRVLVKIGKTEIGNGTTSTVAMIACEELSCDWSKMEMVREEPHVDFLQKGVFSGKVGRNTYSSNRSYHHLAQMQQAGASARERLKATAAASWNVPVAEITVKNGEILHEKSGKKVRAFGPLAAAAAKVKLEKEPAIKTPDEWTFLGVGNGYRKLETVDKVSGKAIYGMDVRVPNMVYAALRQSPVMGGTLKSFDFNAIKSRPGVLAAVVVDPKEPRKDLGLKLDFVPPPVQSAVAVIAESYWQAKSALDVMPIEWNDGPGGTVNSTDIMKAAHTALEQGGGKVDRKEGDAEAALKNAAKVVTATYDAPFLEHALMEPLNCTAIVTDDRVELWTPSQQIQNAHYLGAIESGLPPEKVVAHATMVGGGFGRRGSGDDEPRMAVAVAKKFPGRPVKVIWSREETTRQGRYNPISAAKMQAALGPDGMPTALWVRLASTRVSPLVLADSPYAPMIPNIYVESIPVNSHIMTGSWRGPGYNTNAFYLESFIDEMAVAAGKDPVDYRRALLAKTKDPGWLKVLNEAVDKGGWNKEKYPKGTAQGFAISAWGGTVVANIVKATVSKEGNVKVDTIDVAFDTGRVLNKDGLNAQIEGATIWGLSKTLNEEITVQNGRVVQGNFDDYPMLRIADMPSAIKIHYGGLTGGEKLSEIGEPPIGPPGPALANAVFRATGKRIRSLPFRNHDLSWS